MTLTAEDPPAHGKIQDNSWLICGVAGFRFDLVPDFFRVLDRF